MEYLTTNAGRSQLIANVLQTGSAELASSVWPPQLPGHSGHTRESTLQQMAVSLSKRQSYN